MRESILLPSFPMSTSNAKQATVPDLHCDPSIIQNAPTRGTIHQMAQTDNSSLKDNQHLTKCWSSSLPCARRPTKKKTIYIPQALQKTFCLPHQVLLSQIHPKKPAYNIHYLFFNNLQLLGQIANKLLLQHLHNKPSKKLWACMM